MLVNRDHIIEYLNHIPEGKTRDEIIGTSIYNYFQPDYHKLYRKFIDKVFETGQPKKTIVQAIGLKDNIAWYETIIIPISIEGKINKVIFNIRDITVRRNIETALKTAQDEIIHKDMLDLLINNIPDIIFITDLEGKIKYINHLLPGYSENNVIGSHIYNYIPIEYQPHHEKMIKECMKTGEIQKNIVQVYDLSNKLLWFETRVIPIKRDTHEIESLLFITTDITKKIEVEKNLKDSEEKYRELVNNANSIIIKLNRDGDFLFINEYGEEFFGFSQDELIGCNVIGTIVPKTESSGRDLESLISVILSNPDEYKYIENENITKSGKTVWVSWANKALYDKEGKIIGVLTVGTDITEKKEAEQGLKISEEKYRNIIKNLHLGYLNVTTEGKILIHNPTFNKIAGFDSNKDLVGLNMPDLWQNPEDRKKYLDQLKKQGCVYNYIIYGRKINGEKIILLANSQLLKNDIGDAISIESTFIDITEKHKLEQKLRESEENYRNLYEEAPNAYFSISIDKSILRCNKAAEKLLGYTKEELLSMKVFDLYADTEYGFSKAKELFQKFSKGELIQDEEFQMKRKDDKHIWISLSVKPILDQEGNIIESLSMVIDMNERKRAEEALKSERDKLKAMIDGLTSAGLSIDIIGDDYKVQYMNDLMKERFGDFIGKLCYENYIGATEPCEDCPAMKSIKTNTIERVEQSAVDKRNYEIFSAPIPNPDGTISKAIELVIDITERKKAEQELILLSQLKSELLTRYSHELKTPLMSIKGFTNLLSIKFQDTLHDEELSLIGEITKGCHRLETLVRNILDTADLDSGTVELELTKNDLSSVIRSCVEQLEGFANSRDHTINLKLHEELLISFDIKQIVQVVNNIITNAIKFTPPQGRITIQSEIKEDFITISIRDTGIGFTNEETQILFKRFGKIERFGQGFDIITEGSGLGLYLSRKIVELHGGELWVESEGRNKGSTFYITLPLL